MHTYLAAVFVSLSVHSSPEVTSNVTENWTKKTQGKEISQTDLFLEKTPANAQKEKWSTDKKHGVTNFMIL